MNPALLGMYAHGVAGDGGVVGVNGVTIIGPNAGGHPDLHGPDWFTSTQVLVKAYPPEDLVAVDWQTGAQQTLFHGQISDFCGGGGRWSALGYDGVVRVGDANGVSSEHRNEIAPIAFGADGAFACKRWHQDGLFLDGLELVPSNIRVEDVQVFNTNQCLYRIGRTIHGYGLPGLSGLALPFDFGWVRGIPHGSRVLLACQRYGMGVIAFYADDPGRGWKLGPDPCYRLDIGPLGGGRVRAVWSRVSRDHAEDLSVRDWALSDPMVVFDEVTPPDPPDPPSPEPPDPPDPEPPSMPNHFDVVQRVNAQNPSLLQSNTLEACGLFTEMVVLALAADFPGEKWGHVGKSPGQTQCPCGRGHAADAVMSQLTPATAIDIIAGAHNPPHPGQPAWQEVTSGGQPWKPPMPVMGEPPGPEPPQPPSSDLEARVAALEASLDALIANAVQYGQKIGVRCNNGTVVAIMPGGGPSEPYQPIVFESRDAVGPWESLKVERGS